MAIRSDKSGQGLLIRTGNAANSRLNFLEGKFFQAIQQRAIGRQIGGRQMSLSIVFIKQSTSSVCLW
jgi:hypothetical protein